MDTNNNTVQNMVNKGKKTVSEMEEKYLTSITDEVDAVTDISIELLSEEAITILSNVSA